MNPQVCIFGEVLYDIFPNGDQVLGGAPFNVAWHLQAFGENPLFISRVGDDQEGESIRQTMIDWGMDTGMLQTDQSLPTGRVSIQFDNGEPEYDIIYPCAYDAIGTPSVSARSCRLLYHGSLALRHERSAQTLQQWIKSTDPDCLFVDVNLRNPWWNKDLVLSLIAQADWVKLNIDELDLLFPGEGRLIDRLSLMVKNYCLQAVILTRGEQGADALNRQGEHITVTPGKRTEVVDTVGAGDAFTAVMIMGIVNHWPLETTLTRAQIMASRIVGQRGATVASSAFYQDILARWQTEQP